MIAPRPVIKKNKEAIETKSRSSSTPYNLESMYIAIINKPNVNNNAPTPAMMPERMPILVKVIPIIPVIIKREGFIMSVNGSAVPQSIINSTL